MNHRAVIWVLGCLLLVLAASMLVPALVAAWSGETRGFEGCLLAAAATGLGGTVLALSTRSEALTAEGRGAAFRREALAAVGLAWPVAALFGALPYLLSGSLRAPVDALFESLSGFTTTGATVLSGAAVEGLGRGLLLWRALTQWLGGLAAVVAFVVIFPGAWRGIVPGAGAPQAGEGTDRAELRARARAGAFGLFRLYVAATALLVLLLVAVGPPGGAFDAVLQALGTLSSGGFSSHAGGVLAAGAWRVELLLVPFLFVAGLNFGVLESFLRGGWRAAWRSASRSSEVRAYAGLVVVCTLGIGLVLWFAGDPGRAAAQAEDSGFLRALREALLAVVDTQATAGYAAAGTTSWPTVCRMVLLLLLLSGACAGSTGGGLRLVRVVVLLRAAARGVLRQARPRGVDGVRLDGRALDDGTVAHVLGTVALWVLVFALGTLLVAAVGSGTGGGLAPAAKGVLACLTNAGPAAGVVGAPLDFALFPAAAKLFLGLLMVLGRVELYALLVLFAPRFWRG